MLNRGLSSVFARLKYDAVYINFLIELERVYPKRWYGSTHINYYLYEYYLNQNSLDFALKNILCYINDVPYDLNAKLELLTHFPDEISSVDAHDIALEIFSIQSNRHEVGLYLIKYYLEIGDIENARLHFQYIWGNHNWLSFGYRPLFEDDELDDLFKYYKLFI